MYMPKNTMLVVGSLNMDQVVHVPRIPLLGETLLSTSSLKLVPGGKGANQAVAMARLGAPVAMAGRLGSDPFGEALLRSLRADNVNTDLIVVDQEESSGVALICAWDRTGRSFQLFSRPLPRPACFCCNWRSRWRP